MRTYNHLKAERLAALSAVAQLDTADGTAPARPDAADVDLLDELPYLTGNLSDAPEALLRRLFEATSLAVRITDDGDHMMISIRLPGDTMQEIIGTVETIYKTHEAPGQPMAGACVDAVRAPGARLFEPL
jgi:site-specific DNA recombinase